MSLKTRRLKVAVVGASMSDDPSRHQRFAVRAHLPALRALPDQFEIVAVCTTSMPTARAAADYFHVPHAFDSVSRMLKELPDIDVVCVSVRPVAQYEVVMAALDAGKHVYCEHPFGANSEQAARMTKLAKDKNVRTVVGHEHHYEPAMLELARLMREGFIGKPINFSITFFNSGMIAAQSNLRPWLHRAEMGGPPAWRTGHSLERVTSVLGDIEEVCADMKIYSPKNWDGEAVTQTNNVNLLLRTKSGAFGTLQVCLTAWFGTGWTFQVYGTDGMLMLREEDLHKKSSVKGDPKTGQSRLYGAKAGEKGPRPLAIPDEHFFLSGLDHLSTTFPVAQTWHALAEAINKDAECSPSFRDELKIHRVWDAADKSMVTGCWQRIAN